MPSNTLKNWILTTTPYRQSTRLKFGRILSRYIQSIQYSSRFLKVFWEIILVTKYNFVILNFVNECILNIFMLLCLIKNCNDMFDCIKKGQGRHKTLLKLPGENSVTYYKYKYLISSLAFLSKCNKHYVFVNLINGVFLEILLMR